MPLAIRLKANGWEVKGSTTSPDKLAILAEKGIDPYLVHLQHILTVKQSGFWSCDGLLVNVPPSLRRQTTDEYLGQMRHLVSVVESAAIKNVIFISSTSVYPELNKVISDTNEVDETSPLYRSESLFTQSPHFKTTVIRFGGLIGPGRHPSRFFAGKTDISNGQAPVNLIDQEDCIDIILAVLEQQKFGYTYHAAAPTHPKRSVFYGIAAQVAGAEAPSFVDELKEWKIIDPVKLEDDLGYFFLYPNLLDRLEECPL